MSRIGDAIIVLGDFSLECNRIQRYLDKLSKDYRVVCIDNAVIKELMPNELPLDVLAASICDLVISQFSGKIFRLLIEAHLIDTGFTIGRHLIGRDLNVEFIGVFGNIEWEGFNTSIEYCSCDYNFPIHYIYESSPHLKIPSHWTACDISISDDTKAYIKFCETLNTSKSFPSPELSYQPLFSIQNSRNNNTPIFCIPGAGDNIASFTAMCMAMGADYSIYGMQPRGLDGRLTPHYSVEAAASNYIESIRKIQKKGPIHLIGHSFGGWIAFEIATTLAHDSEQGLSVESITVIDSEIPGNIMCGSEYGDKNIIEQYIESVELYSKKSLSIRLDDWLDIDLKERVYRLHKAMVSTGILPARSTADVLRGPYNTFSIAFRTFYSPRRRYAGEIRLVLAPDEKLTTEKNEQEYRRISSGWKKYAKDLKVFCGGGNHMKILSEPYISQMIEWWKLQNQSAKPEALTFRSMDIPLAQAQDYAMR